MKCPFCGETMIEGNLVCPNCRSLAIDFDYFENMDKIEETKALIEKVKALIEKNGGEIAGTDKWGMKKLAYPIKKRSSGFYHLFEFKAEPAFIKELEIQFKRDERVMRYLTVSLDKDAIEFNKKRREVKGEKTNE